MSYHFDFDPIHRIARFRLEGHISDEEIREYYAAATRFAALTNPAAGLLDASGVTSIDGVSSKTVHELASLPPNIAGQSVSRVLIAPSPAVFGMMRMFGMLGERTRPNLQVVHTEREALAILGVVNPRFEPVPEWDT